MNNAKQNIIDLPIFRICTGCGLEKTASEFYQRRTQTAGKNYQCKECEKEKNRLYHRKLAREYPERIKEYRQRTLNGISRSTPTNTPKRKSIKTTRAWQKDKHYRLTYGLTLDQVSGMLESQLGLCANRACGKEISLFDKANMACVDHCHSSGNVRGILCISCNFALGYLEKKNVAMGLTEYLQKYGEKNG